MAAKVTIGEAGYNTTASLLIGTGSKTAYSLGGTTSLFNTATGGTTPLSLTSNILGLATDTFSGLFVVQPVTGFTIPGTLTNDGQVGNAGQIFVGQ